MQPYDTLEEVNSRLMGTVCLFKGRPVFIIRAVLNEENAIQIDFRALPVKGTKVNKVLFSEFLPDGNAQSYNMGFFDFFDENHCPFPTVAFASRLPTRRIKQGICAENVSVHFWYGENRTTGISLALCLAQDGFKRMLRGEFISLEEAVSKLKDQPVHSGFAIHKDICIRKDEMERLVLMFKDQKAAYCVDEKNLKFTFPSSRLYLKELFENAGIIAA